MHKNVLINMLHNYSRGKNVIMTSSILAQLHENTCFTLIFLPLFDVNDQNKLKAFKDLIFIFLKMVSFVILSHCIIL